MPSPSVAANTEGLGVLGGTFDPIHLGHLIIAERVREALQLSRVLFVPSARPPHKLGDPVTDAHHRLRMTDLAVAPNAHFAASRMELDRQGPSFTIETIRQLRAQGHDSIAFIMGADSLLDLPKWRQPDDILRECQVVAVARPGFDAAHVASALGPTRAAKVKLVEVPLIGISSTDIRERVATGRSIRYLVPEPVEEYIRGHSLYDREVGSENDE